MLENYINLKHEPIFEEKWASAITKKRKAHIVITNE